MKLLSTPKFFMFSFTCVTLFGWTSSAHAQSESHNYVNITRSSDVTHFFVSESVEGEFGQYMIGAPIAASTSNSSKAGTEKWQGYDLTTTVGMEIFKFVQFTAAHSMMDMRSTSSSLESLTGSRFQAGGRLVFLSPIANLEAGGGVIGTRYSYQQQLETASLYGSGVYFSIGANYYFNQRVSWFVQGKSIDEHSVNNNAGPESVSSVSGKTTNLGTGFSLWM